MEKKGDHVEVSKLCKALLTSKEVAAILDCAETTVHQGRAGKGALSGLPFLKIGRMVRYRSEDIPAFLEKCRG